jgi:hypothetical protein
MASFVQRLNQSPAPDFSLGLQIYTDQKFWLESKFKFRNIDSSSASSHVTTEYALHKYARRPLSAAVFDHSRHRPCFHTKMYEHRSALLVLCSLYLLHSGEASSMKILTDKNFEHDTQATTGATTGDWFVLFYAPW